MTIRPQQLFPLLHDALEVSFQVPLPCYLKLPVQFRKQFLSIAIQFLHLGQVLLPDFLW